MPVEIRPTGIGGLDTILGGGLPHGTLLMIAGQPGTGKTILAQQLCFAWVKNNADPAAPQRRAVYFSTLSEPHSKLISHSESFGFFDSDELGKSVEIISLQEFMMRGLDETAAAIVRQTRQMNAGLVVVDGFRAIEAISNRPFETREFLYKLSTQLSMIGATAIVTVERSVREQEAYGDFTTADGVIGLHNNLVNVAHRRRIEVLKLRGIRHLTGLHSYRISDEGWEVFPRLESLIRFEDPGREDDLSPERCSFGLAELDAITGGGLPPGSSTLIAGSPGVGKTLISLAFLHAGLQAGESSLFISFHENRQQLLNKARIFHLPLDEYIESGLLTIHTLPAVELEIDQFSALLRNEIETRGVSRLVIDSITSIEKSTAHEGRSEDYAIALHTYLRQRQVTTVFTEGLDVIDGDELKSGSSPLAIASENLLIMRYATFRGEFYRVLAVVKMRDSDHERSIRQFTISRESGVRILASQDSESETISAITRQFRSGGSLIANAEGPPARQQRRKARDKRQSTTGEENG